MTVQEAQYLYGTKEYTVTYGDTLFSICRNIYKSDDEIYRTILMYLNNRYDWTHIKAGDTIKYLNELNLDITQLW